MAYIYYSIRNPQKSTFRLLSQECSGKVKQEWVKDLGFLREEDTSFDVIKSWADKKGYNFSCSVLVADTF